jgi:NADH-quinone oxidoreductase subunit J
LLVLLAGNPASAGQPQVVAPKAVSLALYGPYLLAVELASLLLLAGLVGAYHLGRREPKKEND